MSATVVFAMPTSSCSAAAAAAIRARVACWASARAFSSYLRFWVDTAFTDVTVPARSINTSFIERTHRMHTYPAPKIVGPSDGKAGSLGSIGVRFMIDTEETARRRVLARRAPDAAAPARRAAAPPQPRGRVLLRARGPDGRAARRRRRLRRGRRPRPQAARPVAHVLERGRRALPDPRDHRPGRLRGLLRRARRRGRRRAARSPSGWPPSAPATASSSTSSRSPGCASASA